jgi:hypothetical protein
MNGAPDAIIFAGLAAPMEREFVGTVYPSDTFTVLGLLRQEGLDVDFEDPLGLHPLADFETSYGYFVPIVRFSTAGLRSRGAQLLPSIILARMKATRTVSRNVHCRIGVDGLSGDTEWFAMSGPPALVVGTGQARGALEQWISDRRPS